MFEVLQLAESPHGQHWATRVRDDPVGGCSEMLSGTDERAGTAHAHHNQVHVLFGGRLENAVSWSSEFHPVLNGSARNLPCQEFLQTLFKELLKSCCGARVFGDLR